MTELQNPVTATKPTDISESHVYGVDLDTQTRCAHYKTPLDIIAIKMKCCGDYYACKECHDELADHASQVWPKAQWNETVAVLCGVCKSELTIQQYFDCSNNCPKCNEKFNPGCRNHYHFYFEQ